MNINKLNNDYLNIGQEKIDKKVKIRKVILVITKFKKIL